MTLDQWISQLRLASTYGGVHLNGEMCRMLADMLERLRPKKGAAK